MRIKDLFINQKSYIVEEKLLNNDCYLYIEALDEYGAVINGNFNADKIKNVLVELSDDCGYYIDTLSDVCVDMELEQVVKKALPLLGGDE